MHCAWSVSSCPAPNGDIVQVCVCPPPLPGPELPVDLPGPLLPVDLPGPELLEPESFAHVTENAATNKKRLEKRIVLTGWLDRLHVPESYIHVLAVHLPTSEQSRGGA